MNVTKCPHCRMKLGNFMYATVCPFCHKELAHNRKPTLSVAKPDPARKGAWPIRMFMKVVRFVES